MILDKLTTFADREDATASIGTVNLGTDVKNDNSGVMLTATDLRTYIAISEDLTSGGAAVVEFQFVSDSQTPIRTDGSAEVHWNSGPIAFASLTTKRELFGVVLPQGKTYKEYVGLQMIVTGAALTGGTISSGDAINVPTRREFPEAVS